MTFVDLFAGLGGFHVALRELGHNCVLACESDPQLCELYKKNFGIYPTGDIRNVAVDDIPPHDILCAGFPCQPFSKAGEQQGTDCPRWGDLFDDHVLRIIKAHNPKFVLLENVPNLGRHKNGITWTQMKLGLSACGYEVEAKTFSPHHFGIPQIRERMFIIGASAGLDNFIWPSTNKTKCSIKSILDTKPEDAKPLSDRVVKCLEVWQDFLDRSPNDEELPSFPIWSMEFGATYPFESSTPFAIGVKNLGHFKGAHGRKLSGISPSQRLDSLPSYARSEENEFPRWKIQFIRQNRDYYRENERWIKGWLPKILEFPPSLQKFEWNCKGENRNIWDFIIQFRASGVRVKRPTTAPSLIAMTSTQLPIVGWERRYMTVRECSRLQSLESLANLPDSPTKAYEALGNAVNATVVRKIAEPLLHAKAPSFKSFHPSSKISSIIKSKNKSKDTQAELVLRKYISKLGLKYRLHVSDLPGKPDLVFAFAKVVVFCDGDFWHGRNWEKLKQELKGRKNSEYWIAKIASNIHRDTLQEEELKNMGWQVVRLWETDILKNPATAARGIKRIVVRKHKRKKDSREGSKRT